MPVTPNKNETVVEHLEALLDKAQKVDTDLFFQDNLPMKEICKEIRLYLVGEKLLKELLLLEAGTNALEMDEKAFKRYAKLINKEKPASKYKIWKRKRAKEIFDRDKIYQSLDAQRARYINKERFKLRQEIKKNAPALDAEKIRFMEKRLEERLEHETTLIDEVLQDYDAYDVVITNYEASKEYPSIYYSLKGERGEMAQSTTHLRTSVPNILWYSPPEASLTNTRSDMKIEEIVKTYERVCDSIYIQKREK